MPPFIRVALAGLVVVPVLALGACATVTNGAPVDLPSSTVPAKATATVLKSTLLRTGDLPSGWVEHPHDTAGDDPAEQKAAAQALAHCIDATLPDEDDAATVDSPSFTDAGSTVSSIAKPLAAGEAAFDHTVVTSAKSDSCFAQDFRTRVAHALPGTDTLQSVRSTVTGHQAGQPSNVMVNVVTVVTFIARGQQQAIYARNVTMLSDSVNAQLSFVGANTAVPATVVSAALSAVSKRVAAT